MSALQTYDGALFAGGLFTSAGGKPSYYIAEWDDPFSDVALADQERIFVELEPNYPNPFNPATTIRFAVDETAHTTLTLYDALGRRVTVLVAGVRSSGEHAVVWDGRREDGSCASPGVYFARLECAGEVKSRKLVLVK